MLAEMAKEHGYRLADGQILRRVPPPFVPFRMEWVLRRRSQPGRSGSGGSRGHGVPLDRQGADAGA